jgi:metal-responsive CopG/Arc/MetJ family transcriptional regulator
MRRRKKKGRPTTGREPMTTFRMPVDLRKAVDRWAARKGVTRSEAIRALIVRGLKK